MKKEYLLLVTPFLVILLSYGLFEKEEYYLSAGIVVVYLALIFGFDKFKVNLKSKTIEIKDENRDS